MTGSQSVVEVRVRELNQLFDTLDPSPFHEQDLEPSASEYIVDSVKELRLRGIPSLRIHIDSPTSGLDADAVQRALRAHFARKAAHLRRSVRELLRDGIVSLAIGLVFLTLFFWLAQTLAEALAGSHWATLARESLLIGGWVALWRPLEIFLYAWWPIVRERRLFDRLQQMSATIIGRS